MDQLTGAPYAQSLSSPLAKAKEQSLLRLPQKIPQACENTTKTYARGHKDRANFSLHHKSPAWTSFFHIFRAGLAIARAKHEPLFLWGVSLWIWFCAPVSFCWLLHCWNRGGHVRLCPFRACRLRPVHQEPADG